MSEPLAVLFEDPHCLAVAKPAGLLTQARGNAIPGELTLEASVRRHLDPQAPGSVYLGTVHRLDRPVSGVVVWAKTARAARRLSAQFASRLAKKTYWAVVSADAELPDEGTWDDRLTAPDALGRVHVASPGDAEARQAVTRYRKGPPARLPSGLQWLVLHPETGRTHQLRAQTAARGLPVVGDSTYGSTVPFPEGIALHARSLELLHPIRRTPMTWVAPLPASWGAWGLEGWLMTNG